MKIRPLRRGKAVENAAVDHARHLDHLAEAMAQRPHFDQAIKRIEANALSRRGVNRKQRP
jgi:hypothetical protein